MDKLKQLFQRWNNRRILRKARQRIIDGKNVGICEALGYYHRDSCADIQKHFKMNRGYAIKNFKAKGYDAYWWYSEDESENIKNRVAYIDYLITIQ